MMTFESATTRGGMTGRSLAVAKLVQDGLDICLGAEAELLCPLRPVRAGTLPGGRPRSDIAHVMAESGADEFGYRLVLAFGKSPHLFDEWGWQRYRNRFPVGHR